MTTATFTDISELVWGPLSPEFAWACWREISSSPWFLCTTPNEPVTVRSAEEAAELVRAAEQKSGEETARNEFTLRLKNSAAGKPGGIIRPDDDRFLQEIEALALGTAAKSKALSRAGLSETPQLAHAILLSCGYWNDERNPWPYRHGLSLSTPQIEVSGPEPDSGRLDLTALDLAMIMNGVPIRTRGKPGLRHSLGPCESRSGRRTRPI